MLASWYFRTLIARELNSSRGELAFRSVFLPGLKAIYIPVPKVAGSTIMSTLLQADGSAHLANISDHNTPDARRRMSALHDPKAFKRALHDPMFFRFAFVRNPYSRVLSAYLEKGIAKGKISRWLDLRRDASLLDFLQRISEQDVREMNRHWRPQSALISTRVRLDFLGRFERFSDDFAAVLDKLGVDGRTIRERRQHETSADDRLSLIGIEEKALIERVYRDDFERFGYSRL